MRRSAIAAAAMLPPGFLRPMAEPGLWPSVALALLVHLLLALFLVFGLRWSTKPPDTVVVELWGAQLPPATGARPSSSWRMLSVKPSLST